MKRFLGLGGGYYNLCFPTIGDWFRTKHTMLHEDRLKQIFIDPPDWPEGYKLYNYNGHDQDKTAQWLRWNEYTGRMKMILLKVDRASMYNSLEVRVPLLDREVVETAARVDWRSCIDIEQKIGKKPLRHALNRHLKHHTLAKRGFTVSMGDWLKGPLRPVFEDMVLSRKELLGIPINRVGLQTMYQRFLSDNEDAAWGLWLLLSLSLWENKYCSLYR